MSFPTPAQVQSNREHWANKAKLLTIMTSSPDGGDCLEPSAQLLWELEAAGWAVLKLGGSLLTVTAGVLTKVEEVRKPDFVLVPKKT
jgi:hypothetical protein